jgi:FAD/FMN-containing dehydrogenase
MMPGGQGPVASLVAMLGPGVVSTDPAELEPLLTDHRKLYHGRALALATPRSVEQVSRILSWCNAMRIGVVPQGGNTGYCGGATPDESGTQLLLSLRRLAAVRSVDPLSDSMVVEAGCTLAAVQDAAALAGRFFPLSLGSEGSCQIGGNLSTNAGGTNVLRYGMARELVLGLEVVLADGRVLSTLGALRKDNTGYDLRGLFVGAEGTLGVITAASLRLFPPPAATATAFAAVPDSGAAVALLARLRAATGDQVSSFELMPRIGIDLVLRHIPGTRDPLDAPSPWYVLAEVTSPRAGEDVDALLEGALAVAMDHGEVTDAALARSDADRQAFWRIRESIPEAQRRDGASLKHDVSVPVAALPGFLEQASAWVAGNVPEGLLVAYGHVGDGNLHFNINQAPGTSATALKAREESIRRAIHDLVRDFHGSFSAEHGIGRLKVGELARYAPPVELALMRAVKRALDPNGIMNPGKVLAND